MSDFTHSLISFTSDFKNRSIIKEAAELLGWGRNTLTRKIADLDL